MNRVIMGFRALFQRLLTGLLYGVERRDHARGNGHPDGDSRRRVRPVSTASVANRPRRVAASRLTSTG
jgi:hypothetical protein